MRSRKNLIPLILAMMILSMPIASSAQILAANVFASRTSLGMLVMDESYNETTEVYSIVFGQAPPDSPSYRPWNIGLGFVEVVFSRFTYPKGLEAYIEIDGEPLIDMLINFTIQNYQHEWPNGTKEQAKYVSAFVYLFSNHSITNESTITPMFQPSSYFYDSSHILADDSQTVLAGSEIERVKLTCSIGNPLTPVLILVIGGGIAVVVIVVLVLYKRH